MLKIFSKKFVPTIIVVSVVFSLVLPLFFANAQSPSQKIWGLIQNIGALGPQSPAFGTYPGLSLGNLALRGGEIVLSSILTGLSKTILAICKGILWGAVKFGEWMIKDPLLRGGAITSDTNPNGNIYIEVGWKLIRDIVNMLFIIGLAWIGLATALNWAGFDTKKTLGSIILAAFLINFSPVICGVIVDVAQIFINFFIQNPNFSGAINTFNFVSNNLSFTDLDSVRYFQVVSLVIYAGFISIVMIGLGLAYFLRHVVLWLLVMLSPIAFFSAVFKGTKKYYDTWKKQFLFWTITFIPISFIVYITTYMMANIRFTDYTDAPNEGGVFEAIFPHLAISLFLLVGFFLAIQLTSAILGQAIAGAKKVAKLGRGVGKIGLGAGMFGAGAVGGVLAGAAGAIKGAKGAPEIKTGKTGFSKIAAGLAGGVAGGARGIFTARGRAEGKQVIKETVGKIPGGRKWYARQQASKSKEIEELGKQFGGAPIETQKKIASGMAFTKGGLKDQMGALSNIIKTNKFDFDPRTEEKLIRQAKNYGLDLSELAKSRPDLVPQIKSGEFNDSVKLKTSAGMAPADAEKEARQEIIKTEVEKMTPGEFKGNVNKKSLEDLDVFFAMDSQKIREVGRQGGEKRQALKNHTARGSSARKKSAALYKNARASGDKKEIQRLKDFWTSVNINTK